MSTTAKLISFDISDFDRGTIREITARAAGLCRQHGVKVTKMELSMDLTATHANGNPLRLEALRDADDFNFLHDVLGIRRHLNRDTGKLEGCFSPRFSDTGRRAQRAAAVAP